MAFTQQNEKDGYLFFAIAFNAVPGKTYAAQVVAAYEAGMTTQQIVNEFATKPAFTDIYGSDLTNAEFAQSFVTNVTANLTGAAAISPTVQAQAIADIEAALDAGLSIGDVITNVITNITNKSVADAEWGSLVQLLINKVAVAEALTEGEFALDTTDAGALQGPLALVTVDPASVQEAITKGGALKALLDSALAADKAEADYAESLGVVLTADEAVAAGGGAKEGDAVTDAADVAALLEARLNDIVDDAGLAANYAAYKNLSAAQKNVAIAGAKADAADDVTLAQDALTTANANVNKVATLSAKGKALDAAKTAATAAAKAEGLALNEVVNQGNIYNIGKVAADQVEADDATDPTEFSINGGAALIVKNADGVFEFTAAASATLQKNLAAVLKSANDWAAAAAASDKADAAQVTAQAAVTALNAVANTAVPGKTAQQLLDDASGAKDTLKDAQDAVSDLDAALADLAAYAAQLTQLDNLADAVTAAYDKLDEADYKVSTLVAGSAVTPDKDVFLVTADSTGGAALVLTAGDDSIYVGSSYKLNADLTKGDNSALEVFFKTNGANTDVYIEQKAIGSSVAGAAKGSDGNIIKITLTGVTADKVSLTDGFITVAA